MKSVKSSIVFNKITYDPKHWSLEKKDESSPEFIRFMHVDIEGTKYHFVIYVNPTDRRGYRTIIKYLGTKDEYSKGVVDSSTFNRSYTENEIYALKLCETRLYIAYQKAGLFPQQANAGNNSHCAKDGKMVVGAKEEPSFLHCHFFGRGSPKEEYIPGIPLGGPAPGEIFDMRGKTKSVPGNEKKIKPTTEEKKAIANFFKKYFEK